MNQAVGILVHGNNHFIVRGSLPNRTAALALVQHWSWIQVGGRTPEALEPWQMPGDGDISDAVAQLLCELVARGVVVHDSSLSDW